MAFVDVIIYPVRKRFPSLSKGNLCLAGKHSPGDMFLNLQSLLLDPLNVLTGL